MDYEPVSKGLSFGYGMGRSIRVLRLDSQEDWLALHQEGHVYLFPNDAGDVFLKFFLETRLSLQEARCGRMGESIEHE